MFSNARTTHSRNEGDVSSKAQIKAMSSCIKCHDDQPTICQACHDKKNPVCKICGVTLPAFFSKDYHETQINRVASLLNPHRVPVTTEAIVQRSTPDQNIKVSDFKSTYKVLGGEHNTELPVKEDVLRKLYKRAICSNAREVPGYPESGRVKSDARVDQMTVEELLQAIHSFDWERSEQGC